MAPAAEQTPHAIALAAITIGACSSVPSVSFRSAQGGVTE
ncbi:hypothetical protein MA6G0728R_2934 [Mycobacteroides abscessus 6G-0728-R]|uniref:Uncharacterized protein n=1 Tax=Mycobacteroides abscessus 21 TaxID=1299324 RepID=A0A829Q0B7_9MYCO|nr:hypothetical protein MA6G0125S_3004 [Mycobacteroides abscessus 6G-0125-S]EIU60705.1 hypothetical protein MA6G1108_2930 [Mycobacteroides abscessus 6G-1108]EIU94131.1 hypothetical protein MA6G0728R_2934 [Mycobacteroides abscessus 6G-0728-R]EUA46210.1 hypothetical protein I543_3047 [Mycobacteroides abscessus 21]